MITRLKNGGIDYHAYQPYRTLKRRIISAKKSLVNEIMKTVKPFMWETGFCAGRLSDPGFRYHYGFFFDFSNKRKEEGKDHFQVGNITIMGFFDNGSVVTDMYMGAASADMASLPIEDLLKIHVFVMNRKEFIKQSKAK